MKFLGFLFVATIGSQAFAATPLIEGNSPRVKELTEKFMAAVENYNQKPSYERLEKNFIIPIGPDAVAFYQREQKNSRLNGPYGKILIKDGLILVGKAKLKVIDYGAGDFELNGYKMNIGEGWSAEKIYAYVNRVLNHDQSNAMINLILPRANADGWVGGIVAGITNSWYSNSESNAFRDAIKPLVSPGGSQLAIVSEVRNFSCADNKFTLDLRDETGINSIAVTAFTEDDKAQIKQRTVETRDTAAENIKAAGVGNDRIGGGITSSSAKGLEIMKSQKDAASEYKDTMAAAINFRRVTLTKSYKGTKPATSYTESFYVDLTKNPPEELKLGGLEACTTIKIGDKVTDCIGNQPISSYRDLHDRFGASAGRYEVGPWQKSIDQAYGLVPRDLSDGVGSNLNRTILSKVVKASNDCCAATVKDKNKCGDYIRKLYKSGSGESSAPGMK